MAFFFLKRLKYNLRRLHKKENAKKIFELHLSSNSAPKQLHFFNFPVPYLDTDKEFVDSHNELIKEFQINSMKSSINRLNEQIEAITNQTGNLLEELKMNKNNADFKEWLKEAEDQAVKEYEHSLNKATNITVQMYNIKVHDYSNSRKKQEKSKTHNQKPNKTLNPRTCTQKPPVHNNSSRSANLTPSTYQSTNLNSPRDYRRKSRSPSFSRAGNVNQDYTRRNSSPSFRSHARDNSRNYGNRQREHQFKKPSLYKSDHRPSSPYRGYNDGRKSDGYRNNYVYRNQGETSDDRDRYSIHPVRRSNGNTSHYRNSDYANRYGGYRGRPAYGSWRNQ